MVGSKDLHGLRPVKTTMGEEEASGGTWNSLGKMIKKSIKEAKKKIKDYVSEDPAHSSTRGTPMASQKSIDPAQAYKCPFCESYLPPELVKTISPSHPIICERCGSRIDQNDL